MSLSESALHIKKQTLERFNYLVEDGHGMYADLLKVAMNQPDSYWEEQSQLPLHTRGKKRYFNYNKG
jgi:hypothetical protein